MKKVLVFFLLLVLMEFFGSMKDTNGNGIPDIDKKYSGPVKCFFPVNSK